MTKQSKPISTTDKGKIVNNLVSISLYLFCIFLFIFMILYLFWCFRSNLKEYGQKELKQVKKGKNWQKSIKQANSGQTGRPFQAEAQRRDAGFRETENCFLFQLSKEGET